MKTFLTILVTALVVGGGTWLANRHLSPAAAAITRNDRQPLFYQSPMHPWIKSDKPGRCTICGMELVPIYPGEKNLDTTAAENLVSLTQNQIQVVNVETATAKVQALVHTLQVAGMIDDDATRHRIISAYVDGRVEKLHVNYMGAEVNAGQPLADYYSPNLLQTEREYRQLSGELRHNTALRLRQMGLNPEQILAVADKPADSLSSQILAPIGGTVVAQNVYEGQYVSTGQKLFELADFSKMWFLFNAYEQDMAWIKLGQTVTVTTPALPGKSFEGQITFIDPSFDETSRSTKVRVELDNPIIAGHRQLLHRLYATGAVAVTAPATLSIPRSALIQTGPAAVVYLDHGGGTYAQTAVIPGRCGDTLVEITAGLTAGDKVVTNGNLLIDGQAELNRSFATTTSPPVVPAIAPTPVAATTLTESQQQAIRSFSQIADAMAAALAADDLATFNMSSDPAIRETHNLTAALHGLTGVEALERVTQSQGFPDLKSARAAFLKFSLAATAVLEPLRTNKDIPPFQIWECPMIDQAIPGALKRGRWLQTGNRPNQNPFFGREMIDCGKEIKP